jgi:hypothetical protein
MTDATESAVQQIARQGMVGAPEWAQRLFDLILAVDADWNRAHRENAAAVRELGKRVVRLEEGRSRCAEKVKELIEEEHAGRHEAHMAAFHAPHRVGDPPGTDFRDRRGEGPGDDDDDARKVWVMWGVGQRVIAVALVVVSSGITMLLSYLIFGKP